MLLDEKLTNLQEINNAVKKLIDANEVAAHTNWDLSPKVVDIYHIFRHLYNPKAISSLDYKVFHMFHAYNEFVGPKGFEGWEKVERLMINLGVFKTAHVPLWWNFHTQKIDRVVTFGSKCTQAEIPSAVQMMANITNDIADKGFTKAALMPLGLIKFENDEWAVLSYLTLTSAGQNYVDMIYPKIMIQEAGLPCSIQEQIHDL